jgi:N-acetylneuraminate synthase
MTNGIARQGATPREERHMTAKVIAEIGCNHMGQLDLAKEMVMIAATVCKVDVVKFQKRHARELLSPEEYDRPHPNPYYAYGPTYGLHREALELSAAEHGELKAVCEQFGVSYSTSIWDLTSAREIIALGPSLLKVPSACNLNRDLLGMLADTYGGEIHVSLGMTTHEEEERIVRFFEDKGRAKDVILYSCTSGYPVKFEDICLLELTRLNQAYGGRVKGIGFSGHHLGIAADIAAMTLGARYIERHFTLDRTAKGTDHAASLEPDGMRRLARDVRNVGKALCAKQTEILPVEEVQRNKLKEGQIRW